jgi:hypothetical protein
MDGPSEEWRQIRLEEFGLSLSYPDRTSSGQALEFDDIRLHARSEDGEAYFELSRHLNATAPAQYEREREFVAARYGADVTPLTATTFNGLPAHEFSVNWGDTVRTFVLVERGRWLFRVVYDPRSPLNHAVLDTIRIE